MAYNEWHIMCIKKFMYNAMNPDDIFVAILL